MFKPEIEFVRFQAEDVLTTSVPAGFTSLAYQADTSSSVLNGNYVVSASMPGFGEPVNTVDGAINSDTNGNVLVPGNWYHYAALEDYGTFGSASNWLTCTDANHYSS